MSQQQTAECPLKQECSWLDIKPDTTLEQLHKHYKECLIEEIKKQDKYELTKLPAEDTYLWREKKHGEIELLHCTYMMVEGLMFSCPDKLIKNRRFKTCTRHQLAEIIVMALESEL